MINTTRLHVLTFFSILDYNYGYNCIVAQNYENNKTLLHDYSYYFAKYNYDVQLRVQLQLQTFVSWFYNYRLQNTTSTLFHEYNFTLCFHVQLRVQLCFILSTAGTTTQLQTFVSLITSTSTTLLLDDSFCIISRFTTTATTAYFSS